MPHYKSFLIAAAIFSTQTSATVESFVDKLEEHRTLQSDDGNCAEYEARAADYDFCINNDLSTIGKDDCDACLINGLDDFVDNVLGKGAISCAVIQEPMCDLLVLCEQYCGSCNDEVDAVVRCGIYLPEIVPGCVLQCAEGTAVAAARSTAVPGLLTKTQFRIALVSLVVSLLSVGI